MAQQILLPRTSTSTHTDKQLGSLEQLEVFTEDEMEIKEFLERPPNDIRPPKPPRKTKTLIQDVIPPRIQRLHDNESSIYEQSQTTIAWD